jgi:hypothetical protein
MTDAVLTELLSLLGLVGMTAALLVIGILSVRLAGGTRIRRRYTGFFLATGLMVISLLSRLTNALFGIIAIEDIPGDLGWTLLYTGLPAAAVTIGVFCAWRYWSWLLAERD